MYKLRDVNATRLPAKLTLRIMQRPG